jgi:hypothetical protein
VIAQAAIETVFNSLDSDVVRDEYKVISTVHAVDTAPAVMRNGQGTRRTFPPDPFEGFWPVAKIDAKGIPELMHWLVAK